MASKQIEICQYLFDVNITHFSTYDMQDKISNVEDLRKLKQFPKLNSASFTMSNLDDLGLSYVCDAVGIDNLSLQDTKITDAGLAALQKLPKLKHLRLKENWQLTDACLPHLRELSSLTDLQLHETRVTVPGLMALVGMDSLRDLLVSADRDQAAYDGLIAVSLALPACAILIKGRGQFLGGRFEGNWG